MFWRKKPRSIEYESPQLLQLAENLGVEKRRFVRIRYPKLSKVCKLPEIHFELRPIAIFDISLGGCCLLDPEEFLGPDVGQDVRLDLSWQSGTEAVDARVVSRVDHRRHIQFLSLSASRQEVLRKSMSAGVRGLSMRRHSLRSQNGPVLNASEIWSSLQNDSLIFEEDLHRLAQIQLHQQSYQIYRDSWPVKNATKSTRHEFEQLILFLANLPASTPKVFELLSHLEQILLRDEA